ncbi:MULTISPECIES: DUF4176 domain-containing protein [unclassified Enterococcus]|uniref:DUF4176 domain-containing protein n=1 Tax=unclassified Enterococcus TaxID=2608891 RepID=UPI00155611D4|nr:MULTISPECIES: DUF4176 domain-containing protein [unclassified Enterococcus]MBS7576316.1 DUF4176 domain-containing protein [Enterococcus sp. MMGLQ5-2]MBS7583549.1 DUF4176 domain-containing protein [Enterococcus sp. MMGLQ5-1]NPD11411.1 DUF4176 domain-containing protein [Enterococcus sp. MMGLQ5-1]NPD36154.1 DUF4176 domain-containing protein [Enterococcus sp. MMGLQ5-2]
MEVSFIYPEGLDPEQVYYFNDNDIDEVIFKGYIDDDEKRFIELFTQWKEKNSEIVPKGDVDINDEKIITNLFINALSLSEMMVAFVCYII